MDSVVLCVSSLFISMKFLYDFSIFFWLGYGYWFCGGELGAT